MGSEQQKTEIKNLIQAALFVSGRALSLNEMSSELGISSIGLVNEAAEELVNDYAKGDGPFYILKNADKYELLLKEPYASRVNHLAGSPDLTKSALRTLAYISKNEPVLQSSVVKAFGSSAYYYIKELLEKNFISARRAGRSKKLETTKHFKEYFNVAN